MPEERMTEEEQLEKWLATQTPEQIEQAKKLFPAVRNLLEKELLRHQIINEKEPDKGGLVQKEADVFGSLNRGTRDKEVCANWHLSAVIEEYENLLEDQGVRAANKFLIENIEATNATTGKRLEIVQIKGNMLPALLAQDPAVHALVRRGRASPMLMERLAMHQSAVAAEDEAAAILRNTERETGLEPTLTQRRPRDINDENKVFDVEFKEPSGKQLDDIMARLADKGEKEPIGDREDE